MHFVAALDRVDGMRCVLGLFEGVVTGAADGYYRMSDKPAATLLHLGPGLVNGLANIHNANRAMSGMVKRQSAEHPEAGEKVRKMPKIRAEYVRKLWKEHMKGGDLRA